jgi:glucoamylase
VDPGTVPTAMDVLTPAGISQADELDYTLHSPVTIAPVVVP